MKIPLNEIKGLERRVRNQMDPVKLEELSDSIKELGLLQPVKVRKNGNGYTLVFGHRRVQAAKSAGLKEIEAIVDDVPDDKLLTQALAENVIREDMAAIDIAKALRIIIDETECTQLALSKKLGWPNDERVHSYIAMLDPDIKKAIEKSDRSDSLGVLHVKEAKAGTGDTALAARVLERAGRDELSARDTRQMAEVVKRASDFGGKKAVDRVLAQPTRRILDTAETLPPRKPKAIVKEVKGRVLFQWIKDPRVILAEEGLKAVSSVVSLIARSEEDAGGARIVLKNLRKLTANVLKQLDDVIGRL